MWSCPGARGFNKVLRKEHDNENPVTLLLNSLKCEAPEGTSCPFLFCFVLCQLGRSLNCLGRGTFSDEIHPLDWHTGKSMEAFS